MLSENQRTSATIIGTTITAWHQLSNISPMTESDTLSASSGCIRTNQKSDTDLYSGSVTSKDALEDSKALEGMPVTTCFKNGKEFWKCNLCKREFSHWNITKVVEHLDKKETLLTVNSLVLQERKN